MYFIFGLLVGALVTLVVLRSLLPKQASSPSESEADADQTALDSELIEVIENLPIGVYLRRSDGSAWMSDAFQSVTESRHAQVLVEEVVERLLLGIAQGESRMESLALVGLSLIHI